MQQLKKYISYNAKIRYSDSISELYVLDNFDMNFFDSIDYILIKTRGLSFFRVLHNCYYPSNQLWK